MIKHIEAHKPTTGIDVLIWVDTIWTPAFLLANKEEWAVLDPDFGHVSVNKYPYWISMPACPKEFAMKKVT